MDAQRILDIILRTKVQGDSKPLVKSLTDIKSGLDMAANAYQQIAQVAADAFDETINKAVDYNLSIRTMAQNLGLATDETSRIVQVMDDFGVSSEQLQTALQLAVKNGFAPSIESIAQLADEYNSIQDPVQRAAVLTEKFGKNWSVLTPALREGGDRIREAADSIDDSLIVTKDAADAAENYRRALDDLQDAITGVKIGIGNDLIPIVTEALKLFGRIGELTSGDSMAGMNSGIAWQVALMEREKEQLWGVREEMEKIKDLDMAGPIAETGTAIDETAQAAARARAAFEELAFVTGGEVTEEFENYQDKQKDLTEKLGELKSKLDETSKRTPWKTDDIANLKKEIEGVNQALWDNQAAQAAANKERLFSMLQDQLETSNIPKELQGEMLMDIAGKMGLIGQKEAELYRQTQEWAQGLGDAAEAAMMTGRNITDIPAYKRIVIEIVTYGLGAVRRAMAATGASGNAALSQRASGGPVSAGTPYVVGEEGPEVFVPNSSGKILPNRGRRGRGGGQGMSITINGNPQFVVPNNGTLAGVMQELAQQGGG